MLIYRVLFQKKLISMNVPNPLFMSTYLFLMMTTTIMTIMAMPTSAPTTATAITQPSTPPVATVAVSVVAAAVVAGLVLVLAEADGVVT